MASTRRKARSSAERELRRQQVAKLRLQGLTVPEITAKINEGRDDPYSQRMVEHDLKAVREAWQIENIQTNRELVDQELAQLHLVRREAWEGWERSQRDQIEVRTKIDGRDVGGEPSTSRRLVEQIQTKRTPVGDPTYLSIVERASESIRKLLGLDAPAVKKVILSGSVGTSDLSIDDLLELSPEELARRTSIALGDVAEAQL